MDLKIPGLHLMHGDCLERMKEIPDGTVDMILTDPPYGTMKGAGLEGWGPDSTGWDVRIELLPMLGHCNRLLRANGVLILFAQDPYTADLVIKNHKNLPFSYRLTWLKDHFANALIAKKAPVSYTEDVCVFFKRHKKHDFEGFHPLRPYAKAVCVFIGKMPGEIYAEMGHQGASHFMRHGTTQFSLCTEATYIRLISLYGLDRMAGFMSFSDLAEIDGAYRTVLTAKMEETTPKIFNLKKGRKYKSNVLGYKKDYTGLHPTQKPIALITDLVETYTDAGGTILDFTMGSGTTGVAAKNTGRNFIGIELDPGYYSTAVNRILGANKCS